MLKYSPLSLCQEWQIRDVPEYFAEEVFPYKKALVLVCKRAERTSHTDDPAVSTEFMNYSLIPRWSKEKKLKFATHNARLESVESKASWQIPFVENHCIVPLSSFSEPIYVGDAAGTVVRFSPESDELLYAAGIWDHWCDRQSGESIESFAIITREALPTIARVGHPRMPILLKKENALKWLKLTDRKPQELKVFLSQAVNNVDFVANKERDLKSGKQIAFKFED